MTYERINFVDQSVERPRTYEMTYNSDGSVTLVDSFGLVDELGTPINADTMNHIEDGIAATAIRKYNANETFALNEWVLATVANETNFYKSLKDNNLGNPLTDTNYWEVVKIGSGGGLPVGTIIPVTASSSYVPEGTLYCDGAEKTQSAFPDLWTNYLISGKLPTCTYSQFQTEVTNTGACYKWAIDTTNKKFKVPFIPDKVLVDIDDTIGVKGNGMTLGLTDGEANGGLYFRTISGSGVLSEYNDSYGKNVGTHTDVATNFTSGQSIGVTTDASKSGIIADTTNAKTYKTIRHFVVVANGSINQSQMDWSEFASSLASKANIDLSNVTQSSGLRRLIEVSDSSLMPSWYKVFEETNPQTGEVRKWCEQGGQSSVATSTTTINLLKSYAYISYNLSMTGSAGYPFITSRSTGSFVADTSAAAVVVWEAKGYIN